MEEIEKLLRIFRYYHEEKSNPYENGSDDYLFWGMERQYVESCKQYPGLSKTFEGYAEDFRKKNPDIYNQLTDTDVELPVRGAMYYIETMLGKFAPNSVSKIKNYLK